MASVKGPLMGLDASGTVAGTITFSKWKGRNYVRQTVRPANPKTAAQQSVRAVTKFVAQNYTHLNTAQKAAYATLAKPSNITAMNAFVRNAQGMRIQNTALLQDPTLAPGAAPAAPTAPAAVGHRGQITVTWTDSAAADKYTNYIYASQTNGFTASQANLVAVVGNGVQTWTYMGLKPGVWYFLIKCGSTSGVFSPATAQVTGTAT
jgi:hypothetical protein